ncbi:MAG: histidinol-phosphate transaminase [Clostridiaceae bacterium]
MFKALLRPEIENLEAYIPGLSRETVKRKYGFKEAIKLASNENPLGPSPKAMEAMKKAVEVSHIYPDHITLDIRKKIAGRFDVKAENVIVTDGASNALRYIGECFLNQGDEVAYSEHTYSIYDSFVIKNNGVIVKSPMDSEYRYDLKALLGKITDKTKIVIICNPNNPTGTLLKSEEIEEFIKAVPRNVIIVLDEAYIDYVEDRNYVSGIKFAKEYDNVVVLRTFSKIYGLAGARIGYAIGSEEIIGLMFKVLPLYATSIATIEGASAALDDFEFVEESFKSNIEGKKYLNEELTKLGFDTVPSETNFIYLDFHTDNYEVFEKLVKRGIIIRPQYGTIGRISIGSPYENRCIIEALKEIFNFRR